MKRFKQTDQRQARRAARKAARPVFALGQAELDFVSPEGKQYYRILPQPRIPGYTYAF